MTVIDIFLIILILSASTLSVFAIVYLKKFSEHVEAMRKDLNKLVERTTPVLENLESVTRRASRVAGEVENYWDEIDSSIKKIRERISGLTSLKKNADVEYPAKDLIKNIKALSKGVSAFWTAFKLR
ncbi:MAG: hypothetical protein AB1298_00270 [Bacteroidota bacterium]